MIPKEDLRWYLFEETCEIYSENGHPRYEEKVLNDIDRFLSYYPVFKLMGMTSKMCYNLSKSYNKDENDILCHDLVCKYGSIFNKLEINYNPLYFGINKKPFIMSLKGKLNFYSLYDIYKDLYNGIINYNDELLEKSFIDLMDVFGKINPEVIILSHENTPETRLMALVSKELGIPTVEIQHGAYSGKEKIVTGYYVDYVFVWGEYFKNLYLKSKAKKNREIKILGYPLSIEEQKPVQYNKRVVYLGQPLELYYENIFNSKKDFIKKLNILCRDLGFKFIYKPHPGEDLNFLKTNLPEIKFCPKGEKLVDTLKNNDIFISFNSTSLIEAALNSKLSIQLKNFNIAVDNFEKLGICRSFNSLTELKEFLKDLKSLDDMKRLYSPVNPNYIEIPSPNPGEKFVSLLKEILNSKY